PDPFCHSSSYMLIISAVFSMLSHFPSYVSTHISTYSVYNVLSMYCSLIKGNYANFIQTLKSKTRSEEHTSELHSPDHLVYLLPLSLLSLCFPYTTLFRSPDPFCHSSSYMLIISAVFSMLSYFPSYVSTHISTYSVYNVLSMYCSLIKGNYANFIQTLKSKT